MFVVFLFPSHRLDVVSVSLRAARPNTDPEYTKRRVLRFGILFKKILTDSVSAVGSFASVLRSPYVLLAACNCLIWKSTGWTCESETYESETHEESETLTYNVVHNFYHYLKTEAAHWIYVPDADKNKNCG